MRIEKAQIVLAAIAALTLSTVCRTASPIAPSAVHHRAILISFDGLSADEIEQRDRSHFFDGSSFVTKMLAENHYRRVVTINPSLTAAAHAAIVTGTTPDHNGIMSNWLHPAGTPIDKKVSGFDADNSAETLWEAAERGGLKVGVIAFPGADNRDEHRRGDWGLDFAGAAIPARLEHLHRNDFSPATAVDVQSFSLPLETRRAWSTPKSEVTVEVTLLAIDTTDDAKTDYDTIEVFVAGRRVDENRWFPVSAVAGAEESLYGSWSKILKADPALAEVSIYWGAVSATRGYPDSYRRMIDREIGFWPGAPDDPLSRKWFADHDGLDPESFTEQALRFSHFFITAAMVSMARMPFDLLLSYDPIIDQAQHHYMLVNANQRGWSVENEKRSSAVRDAAYRDFSTAADQLASRSPADAALFVTGDHGIAPCEIEVGVAQLLVDWGYVQLAGKKTAPTSRWAVLPSGNYALLYRSPTVPDSEVKMLAARLSGLKTPDGSPVFERVELKKPSSHPNAGDIAVTAFPRFNLAVPPGTEIFAKSSLLGEHGGLNTHRELNTVLMGRYLPQSAATPLQQTSVARIISNVLGVDPPRNAQ